MATIVIETLPVVDAIAEKMEADGLSRREAAERLGVSHGTVTNWLRGTYPPPLNADSQQAIGRFLGVSPRRVIELFDLDLGSRAMRPYRTSAGRDSYRNLVDATTADDAAAAA